LTAESLRAITPKFKFFDTNRSRVAPFYRWRNLASGVSRPLSHDHDSRPSRGDEQRAAFARVFAQHDRWLFGYLLTLLGNAGDAEDVFQETCVVLWREYEAFDLSTNFMNWAGTVAFNQVRRFRRTLARREKTLSDEVVDMLSAEVITRSEILEARRLALHGCLQKLAPSDRQLVEQCYSDGRGTIREAAERLGRPTNTVYKALNRIRRALHACIDRRLSMEGLYER
jgi:RNA polymerase sigma-70 factor, ECF subfamily